MNFRIYDLISKLIPGGVLYIALFYSGLTTQLDKSQVLVLVAMFVLGYLNETIASLLERAVLFRLFKGNPAEKLLDGKKFIHIKLFDMEEVNKIIDKEMPSKRNDLIACFLTMQAKVNKGKDTRIESFQTDYAFARNILIAIFLENIIYIFKDFEYQSITFWLYCFINIAVLYISFLRCKQRNYYYCKEVIEVFVVEKSKQIQESTP